MMDAEQPLPAQSWWTCVDTAGWGVEVMSGQDWIQAIGNPSVLRGETTDL